MQPPLQVNSYVFLDDSPRVRDNREEAFSTQSHKHLNHSFDTPDDQKQTSKNEFEQKHISLDSYLKEMNLPTVIESVENARKDSIKIFDKQKIFEKKRKQINEAKKQERKKHLSESQLLVEQKLIMKNMAIRQRAVNETPPMIGFQT